jgi:hypothetical protein
VFYKTLALSRSRKLRPYSRNPRKAGFALLNLLDLQGEDIRPKPTFETINGLPIQVHKSFVTTGGSLASRLR